MKTANINIKDTAIPSYEEYNKILRNNRKLLDEEAYNAYLADRDATIAGRSKSKNHDHEREKKGFSCGTAMGGLFSGHSLFAGLNNIFTNMISQTYLITANKINSASSVKQLQQQSAAIAENGFEVRDNIIAETTDKVKKLEQEISLKNSGFAIPDATKQEVAAYIADVEVAMIIDNVGGKCESLASPDEIDSGVCSMITSNLSDKMAKVGYGNTTPQLEYSAFMIESMKRHGSEHNAQLLESHLNYANNIQAEIPAVKTVMAMVGISSNTTAANEIDPPKLELEPDTPAPSPLFKKIMPSLTAA